MLFRSVSQSRYPASNTPTQTPTNTATNTPSNTPSNTASVTPSITASNTPTQTPSNTPSVTPSITASNTPTPTPTNTASNTSTHTQTPTQTGTVPLRYFSVEGTKCCNDQAFGPVDVVTTNQTINGGDTIIVNIGQGTQCYYVTVANEISPIGGLPIVSQILGGNNCDAEVCTNYCNLTPTLLRQLTHQQIPRLTHLQTLRQIHQHKLKQEREWCMRNHPAGRNE